MTRTLRAILLAVTIAANVAGAASTGRSTQGHVQWAPNQAAWWVLYLSGTQSLAAAYSADGASWTTPVASGPGASVGSFSLAHAHGSEGRNFGFSCLDLASTDVLHMAATYAGTTGSSHARFTLGTTWTDTNAEAPVAGHASVSPSGMVTATVSGNIPVDGGPTFGYGGSESMKEATGADAGTGWAAGFGGNNVANSTAHDSTSAALFDTGSATLLFVMDNNGAATDSSSNLSYNKWASGAFGTPGSVFASNWTANENGQCWGACLRTTSDVHVVALTDGASTFGHRRWNGTAWSDGDTIPTLTLGANSGISLVSDGTSVWAAAIDSGGTVQVSKWVPGTWSAWSALEAGRTSPAYITGAYGGGHILWAWTEGSGASNIVGTLLSTSPGPPVYTATAAGGCVLGGLAVPAATFAGASAGGALAGGSAAPAPIFAGASAGGAMAGGSATPAGVLAGDSSGGAAIGGLAAPSTTFAAASAGGAMAGGSASGTIGGSTFAATASGGPVAGGLASPTTAFAAIAAGGSVGGGSASPSATFAATAAGGAVAGGSAAGSLPSTALVITCTLRAVEIVPPAPASPFTIDPDRTQEIVP